MENPGRELDVVRSVGEALPDSYIGAVFAHLAKLEEFFSRYDDEEAAKITPSELFAWAEARKLGPAFLHFSFNKLVEHYIPATLEMFKLWSEYSLQFLGESSGREYIEAELGCSIEAATDKAKLSVFDIKERKREKTLDDYMEAGASEVVYICENASAKCRRHDGLRVVIHNAFVFENEVCPGCVHKWINYPRREDDHLYTLDEMRAAFNPSYGERYWWLDSEIAEMKRGGVKDEAKIKKMIAFALHDFGHYDDGGGLARAHRIVGEMYLYMGDEREAAEHFRIALQYNPGVGVKRKLAALIREGV